MNSKNSIIKNLFILMAVFIGGYTSLILIHIYFTNVVNQLDQQVKNEHSRYKVVEYTLNEILKIESDFYKMSLLSKKSEITFIKNKVFDEIKDLKKAVDILENGGILDHYIKLNLVNLEKVKEKIVFKPNEKTSYSFEAIDLIPKILTIESKLLEVNKFITLKNKLLNKEHIDKRENANSKIKTYLKNTSSLFERIKEHADRLLYDSKLNIEELNKKINSKKDYYHILELSFTFLIMSIVIILGMIISKQIRKKSNELKFISEEARDSAIEASNANKVKSEFLANMSHEIRTPLNSIIGFSEILSQANLIKKDKEQANIILKSAKALLNIINDILDISKVESGKLEIINEKFASRRFFEQLVELFSVNAEQKNIRFLYNYDIDIPTFLIGDTIRLKQVISNLLSNAIKFTKNGKHVIFTVKLVKLSAKSAHINLSVKDEGIGISQKNQNDIFLPFSQADSSISRKFGGTGLGLTISQKIIQMMGSKIKLISKKDKGSEFYFDLDFLIPKSNKKVNKRLNYNFLITNLNEDEENIRLNLINYLDELGEVVKLDSSNEELKKDINLIFYFGEEELFELIRTYKNKYNVNIVYVGNRINLERNDIIKEIDYYIDVPLYGSKIFNIISSACDIDKKELTNEKIRKEFISKILVAEDNENNQRLIQILLEKLGITCTIVQNGKEAIEKFEKDNFDLIFMDINMPIMDGLTALSHIKKSTKYITRKTPIVALTANTIKGDKERYINAGMDNYLSKPIVMNELLHILNLYLVDDPLSKILLQKDANKSIKTTKRKKENIPKDKKSEKYKKSDSLKQLSVPEEIVDKLLNKFIATIDSDIKKIEKAIISKDNESIHNACHYLKGPSSNFAMHGAVELLIQFETIAKQNLDKEYDLAKLKEYFEDVKKVLK